MQQVYIKAFILLGRVVRFLQRAPEPVGSGWPKEPPEDLRETCVSLLRLLDLGD